MAQASRRVLSRSEQKLCLGDESSLLPKVYYGPVFYAARYWMGNDGLKRQSERASHRGLREKRLNQLSGQRKIQ